MCLIVKTYTIKIIKQSVKIPITEEEEEEEKQMQ